MNEEELRKQIQKELHNTLKIINENRLNDLRYAVEHGHYPKTKYFPEDFYFSNKINDDDIKRDFYWDNNDKYYYRKKIKNGRDVAMINNLIKKCQDFENFNGCEECGYNCDNEHNEYFCLTELIKRYNEKYNVNYKLIDYDRFSEVKQLLDEC